MSLLVATHREVFRVDPDDGRVTTAKGIGAAPACLAAHPRGPERAWCGTAAGVLATEDGGATWRSAGLEGAHVSALAASPDGATLWAGTDPSAVWRAPDASRPVWERAGDILAPPSSSEWSFPPAPQTHHVRWIEAKPDALGALFLAIEAGALIATRDAGRTWHDRVEGGPYDTHELAIHPRAPDVLRVAAGDGYFESHDSGATWTRPRVGLDVGYFRSVAIDPGDPRVVVASAARGPFSAYASGRSDGRIFRKEDGGAWERITKGWPDPPATIAPILRAGNAAGELWAADERGVHRSTDGGRSWREVAPLPTRDRAPWDLRVLGVPV